MSRRSARIDATTPAQSAGLVLRKNNVNRWLLFADTTPETGLNTGSDLRIDGYDDTGTAMGTSLFLERATRRVGIGTTGPTLTAAPRVIHGEVMY